MENTPDNGKNLMEEAVDIVRTDRRAREEKKTDYCCATLAAYLF